jgi:glycosyltransferase involved in cell wall biosynthesis
MGREVRPLGDLLTVQRLFRLIRQYRPHIVHTHTAKAGVVGRIAARLARVPIVIHTYHGHVLSGYFGPATSAFYRRLETWLSGVTDVLVAVSESVRDDLVSLGVAPANRFRVVPLGLELERFRQRLPRGRLREGAAIPDEAPLVGAVGRLVPIKDLATFLRAARQVRESRPDCHFAIVGDGSERVALEAESRALGLDGNVRFLGWRRDLDVVFGDLDVVVNSSLNEGTPVSLIEALAASRPVVATRVGGTPDLLREGAHGFLVPPADPQSLAAAILRALEAPDDAVARARRGQAHVLAQHNVSRLLDDLDALYRERLAARAVAV